MKSIFFLTAFYFLSHSVSYASEDILSINTLQNGEILATCVDSSLELYSEDEMARSLVCQFGYKLVVVRTTNFQSEIDGHNCTLKKGLVFKAKNLTQVYPGKYRILMSPHSLLKGCELKSGLVDFRDVYLLNKLTSFVRYPSYPSYPSFPRFPSYPSFPRFPSYPSFPR